MEKNYYFIADSADIIGNITLEENANVWFGAVLRADTGSIHVGKNSNIQDCAVLHTGPGINVKVGDNVSIGHGAIVHGCTVGDNTTIGMGAIIMNRAIVGKNCIIGAGTLITEGKEIPDNSIVIGNPGKIYREATAEDVKRSIDNASHYVQLASDELA